MNYLVKLDNIKNKNKILAKILSCFCSNIQQALVGISYIDIYSRIAVDRREINLHSDDKLEILLKRRANRALDDIIKQAKVLKRELETEYVNSKIS